MKHTSALTAIPLVKPERLAVTGVPHTGTTRSGTAGLKPDFFIVGAPKCGTTALANYLARHPDIFMARKEMHFFGKDLRFASSFYRRAEPEYLREFIGGEGKRRIGEASVWYLFSKTAAAEIKAFNPQARIIVMLRNPVEMIYSLFNQFRLDGNEPLENFEDALQAEADRQSGKRIGRQTYLAQALAYRETACFASQLQRYYEVFGRERVQVITQEDFNADPAGVYRQTLEFLDVNPDHTLPDYPRVNTAEMVKSRTVQMVLNDPWVRSIWLAIRPVLPRGIFHALSQFGFTLLKFNASARRQPPMNDELRFRLQREFKQEIIKIGDLIGRDLSHWNRETPTTQVRSAVQHGLSHTNRQP